MTQSHPNKKYFKSLGFPDCGWVLLIGSVWLFSEFLLLGSHSVIIFGDNTEVLIPGLMSAVFSGISDPLWDPFSAAGTDRTAFGYLGAIDVFLFTHLPGWLAYGARVASMYLFSVFAVYGLARATFRLGVPASIFVSFSYGLQIHAYLIHSVLAYLPVVLFAMTCLFEDRRDIKRWVFLAAAIILIAHTSYFSRLVPYAGAAVVFWFLFVDTRKNIGEWLIIASTSLALLALRVGDLKALLSQAPFSHALLTRGQMTLTDSFEQFVHMIGPFGTSLHNLSLLLFVFALLVLKGGDRRMKIMLFSLLLGAALIPLGTALQIYLSDVLPFLRGYSITIISIIPATILTFAGGYGVQVLADHALGKDAAARRRIFSWGSRLGLILVAGTLLFASAKSKYSSMLNWVTHGTFANNFESPVLKKLAVTLREHPLPSRVETFQLSPAYLHAYGIETVGGYVPLYSRRYYEFWGTMVGPWVSGLREGDRLFQMFADRTRQINNWLKFRGDRLMLFPDGKKTDWRLSNLYRLNFMSLANVGYFVSRDRLTDSSLVAIRQPGAPWSSLSKREQTRINVEANFSGREHLYIYKNKDAFPRFFTVRNIKPFETGKAVLEAMAEATIDDLRNSVFVEKSVLPEGLSSDDAYANAEIRLDRYTSDEISLKVTAKTAAVLIVSNSYSPYWSVEIDGKKSSIFPAYHAFWGVRLPAGAKSVVFRYEPPYR